MAVLSCFALKNIKTLYVAKSTIGSFRHACRSKVWNNVPMRYCHERTLLIRNSRFEYKKFKNLLNLYFLLGAIPIVLLITYVNVFIGPATLALIPEEYEPKPWEYYRHPITRFFAKHFSNSPHETHERNLHNVFFHNEKRELNLLRNEILKLMRQRLDYQAWYFDKPVVKYVRKVREDFKDIDNKSSMRGPWIY